MGLQTILQDSHPCACRDTQLKHSQRLHTQFNQGLCLWKWACVTPSVSVLSMPASLSLYLSINVSFCLAHGPLPSILSDCLSDLICFQFRQNIYHWVHFYKTMDVIFLRGSALTQIIPLTNFFNLIVMNSGPHGKRIVGLCPPLGHFCVKFASSPQLETLN